MPREHGISSLGHSWCRCAMSVHSSTLSSRSCTTLLIILQQSWKNKERQAKHTEGVLAVSLFNFIYLFIHLFIRSFFCCCLLDKNELRWSSEHYFVPLPPLGTSQRGHGQERVL